MLLTEIVMDIRVIMVIGINALDAFCSYTLCDDLDGGWSRLLKPYIKATPLIHA